MQLNATFIVQIVNFALSYVVLSKFLLRPFVQRIHQKQAARQALVNALKDKEAQLQQLGKDKQEHLKAFQSYVHTTYQPPMITLTQLPVFEEKPLDEHYVQDMIKKTSALVVKKVPHVS